MYEVSLPQEDIDAYYELKDKLYAQVESEVPGGDEAVDEATQGEESAPVDRRWVALVPPDQVGELRKALMKRLISSIERLDKVQRDKPGNLKLWREKLVSERYWGSLCDSERLITEEIDCCVAEADELEPGWREFIFRQAVQCWRMSKQREVEKKVHKKQVEFQKKQVVKDAKAIVHDKNKEIADKIKKDKDAEKMMEKMIREEEAAASKSKKGGAGGAKAKAKAPGSGKKK